MKINRIARNVVRGNPRARSSTNRYMVSFEKLIKLMRYKFILFPSNVKRDFEVSPIGELRLFKIKITIFQTR